MTDQITPTHPGTTGQPLPLDDLAALTNGPMGSPGGWALPSVPIAIDSPDQPSARAQVAHVIVRAIGTDPTIRRTDIEQAALDFLAQQPEVRQRLHSECEQLIVRELVHRVFLASRQHGGQVASVVPTAAGTPRHLSKYGKFIERTQRNRYQRLMTMTMGELQQAAALRAGLANQHLARRDLYLRLASGLPDATTQVKDHFTLEEIDAINTEISQKYGVDDHAADDNTSTT